MSATTVVWSVAYVFDLGLERVELILGRATVVVNLLGQSLQSLQSARAIQPIITCLCHQATSPCHYYDTM